MHIHYGVSVKINELQLFQILNNHLNHVFVIVISDTRLMLVHQCSVTGLGFKREGFQISDSGAFCMPEAIGHAHFRSTGYALLLIIIT